MPAWSLEATLSIRQCARAEYMSGQPNGFDMFYSTCRSETLLQ